MKTKVAIIAVILVIITILPIYVQADNVIETKTEILTEEVKAKVVESNSIEEVLEENKPTKKVQKVTVMILEGEYKDEEYEMEYVITEDIENITSNAELKDEEKIKVYVEEKEGEVTKVTYKETINQNYTLYIIGAMLITLLFIISRKRAVTIYLLTIILVGIVIIFSIKSGWNIILVSSIISFFITIILYISINKVHTETLIMIIRAIIGITIAGILTYLLFDIMKLESINIKITDKLVDIKSLICSVTILFSSGIYNAIMISAKYIFYSNNKPYKTKSDNIIEGQRSLKL